MARWEPNTRGRLIESALDLFEQHGYDNTSVEQIADRAGVTKTTFFRQFVDKRDVLSAGQEEHSVVMAEAIESSSPGASPLDAVEAAVRALADTFPNTRRAFAARVHAVTSSNDELSERAGLKFAGYVDAVRQALIARGVAESTAAVAAHLGLLAFSTAFDRWTGSDHDASLTELVSDAIRDVHAASQTLDVSPSTDLKE